MRFLIRPAERTVGRSRKGLAYTQKGEQIAMVGIKQVRRQHAVILANGRTPSLMLTGMPMPPVILSAAV